jgi:hypothetical protein
LLIFLEKNLNIFPIKTVTTNIKSEYQYNSAANRRYTSFADAAVKFKYKKWDVSMTFALQVF